MEENKKNTESKSQKDIFDEIKKLSEKANELSDAEQLNLFPDIDLGEEDVTFDSSLVNDTANPEKSHKLYYGMMRLMIGNLPRGKENRKLRRYIYDEKLLFLNRGKDIDKNTGIRGSDSRMTYIPNFLEVAFDTTVAWVKSGGTPFDLFTAFWDLNESRNYHHESEELKKDDSDELNPLF
jgi:hypothetical protein